VNPFLVMHPTHTLVLPREHRAHRLKSAAVGYRTVLYCIYKTYWHSHMVSLLMVATGHGP